MTVPAAQAQLPANQPAAVRQPRGRKGRGQRHAGGSQLELRVPGVPPTPPAAGSHSPDIEPRAPSATCEACAQEDDLEQQNRLLRRQLLLALARAGEVTPPPVIETTEDADTWLAWAQANHHQAGCLLCRARHNRHASGAKSRLAREGVTKLVALGSHAYSNEELIAEMCSAYLCGEAGFEQSTLENAAAYIGGWLKLRDDKRLVLLAAAKAQGAADLVLGHSALGGTLADDGDASTADRVAEWVDR